jgi:hypothetical protein
MPRKVTGGLLPSLCAAALAAGGAAPSSEPGSVYAPWPNGPPQSPDFFPIAVWWQQPTAEGLSGKYFTQAEAVAGEHMTVMIGLSGKGKTGVWPERFGEDEGELEAIKANKLYLVGGVKTPFSENESAGSVASMIKLAKAIGASANLIGYNVGDEPDCATMLRVPEMIAGISRFDPSRVVLYNETAWVAQPRSPQLQKCSDAAVAALRATSIASADMYPLTNPWFGPPSGVIRGDFLSTPNDGLFKQGEITRGLIHYARPGQPVWLYVEAGGDNFGGSKHRNKFDASITAGSTTITNESGWSHFTAAWLNLTLTGPGIPGRARIVSVTDPTHAVMSVAATASAKEPVKVGGGVDDTNCVARVNLCVVGGNEYRATPAEVNAEVWISLINGAHGIQYFCHDSTAFSFCLGNKKGGEAADEAQKNLTFINKTILDYARILNSRTIGICSMQRENYQDHTSSLYDTCADGVLEMSTNNPKVPGMAMVKSSGGMTYLFAQSDRRSPSGAEFTFKLRGTRARTAKVVYDSNDHYDPTHSTQGQTLALTPAGAFSDGFGAHNDNYQVKIYAIQ